MDNLSGIDIGNRIKLKLNELNLKQKDLTILASLSKNAVSNYISGNRIPDTMSILKISKALNVSIEWLLTGEKCSQLSESKTVPNELKENYNGALLENHFILDNKEKTIIELIRKVPNSSKALTIKYLEGYLDATINLSATTELVKKQIDL